MDLLFHPLFLALWAVFIVVLVILKKEAKGGARPGSPAQPRIEPPKETPPPKSPPPTEWRPPQLPERPAQQREAYVLLVDDDPEVIDFLGARLERAGYRVTTASDAWQEVLQAQGLKIGLVITDINMPGPHSGIDAYKRLRSLPNISPRLPVIFITNTPLAAARRSIPADSLVRLLAKPIDFELLRAAIKELTGLDRQL